MSFKLVTRNLIITHATNVLNIIHLKNKMHTMKEKNDKHDQCNLNLTFSRIERKCFPKSYFSKYNLKVHNCVISINYLTKIRFV